MYILNAEKTFFIDAGAYSRFMLSHHQDAELIIASRERGDTPETLGRAYIDLREIGKEDDKINAMLDVIRVTELALDAKRKQLKEAKNEGLLHTGRGDEDREVPADGQ